MCFYSLSLYILYKLKTNHLQTQQFDYELKSSNLIYVSNSLNVVKSFKSDMTQKFMADVENVNFEESEAVRTKINAKVEQETNSKIKDIIPPGSYLNQISIHFFYQARLR